jgi:hypothetical protein
MKNLYFLIFPLLIFAPALHPQSEFSPNRDSSGNNYITDSTFFWLGNTFGQSWFKHKVFRPEAFNNFGDVLTAYDYEYDTLGLFWYKQRFYEGRYFQDGLRKRWLTFVFDQSEDNWRMADSLAFNQAGQPVTGWFKIWSPLKYQFVDGRRSAYFYNDNDQLHIQYSQHFDTTTQNWQRRNYRVIYYNLSNADSLWHIYAWNNNQEQWNDSARVSYFYNEEQLIDAEITQLFTNGDWVNSKYVDYSYNTFDLPDTVIDKQWNATLEEWVDQNKTVYNYTSAQLTETKTDFLWDGSQWLNKTRISYQYNADNLIQEILNEYWSFGFEEWAKASLSNYSYDENLNRNQFNFYIWNTMNEAWQNFYREDNFWSFFEANNVTTHSPDLISFYPNPATDAVKYSLSGKNQPPGPVRFFIYDVAGNLVKSLELAAASGTINITNLKPGIYPVKYTFDHFEGTTVIIKN